MVCKRNQLITWDSGRSAGIANHFNGMRASLRVKIRLAFCIEAGASPRFRRNHFTGFAKTSRNGPGVQKRPLDEEVAMNAIVANVLMHEAAKARANAHPFKIIALFCSVGLLASLCLVAWGLDLGAEFF
jgi:hypothetical protein